MNMKQKKSRKKIIQIDIELNDKKLERSHEVDLLRYSFLKRSTDQLTLKPN